MSTEILTQARLKELLQYDPSTGLFTWLASTSNRVKVGSIAGYLNKAKGYVEIMIDCRNYYAHRLVCLYMTGEFPSHEVDHMKHTKHDNRWGELRAATHQENHRNQSMPKNNTSGTIGVAWHKHDKKWQAAIRVNDKQIHLGSFVNKQDAIKARKKAEVKYDFHCNHGI